ncbi:MAG: alpha/beta hydrolase [Bacillota bacterium]|nr:alpha/beta hydrolase [Bacillota bacterium]
MRKKFERQLITLEDGLQVNYYLAGEQIGKPLILLHGGGTDHALLSWRETIPVLANAGYRVYAPDYPGYGESPPGNKPATIKNLIGYLDSFIEYLELDQVTLIGLSMGGAIALGYAINKPSKVSSLVLIGSYGIQDKAPYHFYSYLYLKIPGLNNALWSMIRNSRWVAKTSIKSIIRNPRSRTESLVDEVLEAMKNGSSHKAFNEMQQDEILCKKIKTNFTNRLPELQMPVLIIHGTHDIGVPVKYARRAASLIRNSRLEVIENAGHWIQRDYPEIVNKIILDFVCQGGGSPDT